MKIVNVSALFVSLFAMPVVAEVFLNDASAKVNIYVMPHDESTTHAKFGLAAGGNKKVDFSAHTKEGIFIVVKQARSMACCEEHDAEDLAELVTRSGRCPVCGDSECASYRASVTRGTKCACNGVNLKVSTKDMSPENEFVVTNGDRGRLKIRLVRRTK